MTSAIVCWRVAGACDLTGAWRKSQKLGRHVEARVSSDEGQNLRFCRSVNEEAVMVARVLGRRSGSQESEAARGYFLVKTEARGGT